MYEIKDFRNWFASNLRNRAKDIALHGADTGLPGITTSLEIVRLFRAYEFSIMEIWLEFHSAIGEKPFSRMDSELLGNWMLIRERIVWDVCEILAGAHE